MVLLEYLFGEKINRYSFPPLAIVAGNFDGLHMGHIKLIDVMKEYAHEKVLKTAVVSLSPHPTVYFGKILKFEKILLLKEKKCLLEQYGIDYYIELPFNKELAEMPPVKFFEEILIEKLNCYAIAIGEDYRFGKNREGDAETARKICEARDIHVTIVTIENCGNTGEKISSTLIRKLISDGRIDEANKLLGYDYLAIKKKKP